MATSPSTWKRGVCRLTAGWPYYVDNKTTHRGIDIVCGVSPTDRVVAVEDGYVVDIEEGDRDKSGYIKYEGNSGYTIVYKHMGHFEVDIGQEIEEGQVLATPNLTNTDSLHLHMEVWDGDKNINPLEYLFGVQEDLKYEMSSTFKVDSYYRKYYPEMYQELIKRGAK
jgi:murein DD-endopeptidase MepM/ murein hydrolase activator NlpD